MSGRENGQDAAKPQLSAGLLSRTPPAGRPRTRRSASVATLAGLPRLALTSPRAALVMLPRLPLLMAQDAIDHVAKHAVIWDPPVGMLPPRRFRLDWRRRPLSSAFAFCGLALLKMLSMLPVRRRSR